MFSIHGCMQKLELEGGGRTPLVEVLNPPEITSGVFLG